jgi:hypothetical protein
MQSSARIPRLFTLFLLFPLLAAAPITPASGGPGEPLKSCHILTAADAERILGQPVRLTRDDAGLEGEKRRCWLTYTGVSKDGATGEDCNLNFLLEQNEKNPSTEQARQVLASTRASNSHDQVITGLPGIGDEAFLFGDIPSVYFIMARKGPVVIRLQIKQATATVSLPELKAFAAKVARQL